MKTSLEHLPEDKRAALRAIAELLQESASVELVILFGSYARGDWVEDPEGGYRSDYDLLVVVRDAASAEDDRLWAKLGGRARQLAHGVPVTLLVHDIQQINREIRTGRYFFSDILLEGIELYGSRRVTLARPKALNAGERLEIARQDFRYWFESASHFWHGVAFYTTQGKLAHAAFLLHQAAERFFHAALLVFTGYKPKTHDLELLAAEVAPLEAGLVAAMPRGTPEDERLFKLLKRAYIEARYSKSYSISAEELGTLRERVRDLAARVHAACTERLATFVGADAVGPLPEVPEPRDPYELPPAPALDDRAAIERWRDAVATLSEARGRAAGREEGLREGEARGRRRGFEEGQARAIVDVLGWRGVPLTEDDAERILACRDGAELRRWWDRARSATSATELFDADQGD